MNDARPPRPPTSPWLVGAVALGSFVGLAIFFGSSNLAVEFMIAAGLLGAVLVAFRRPTPDRGADMPLSETAPPIPPQVASRSPRVSEELPAVLTLDEAAAYLRSNVPTVVSLIEAGKLPGNRLGGNWRIRKASLDVWLDGAYRNAIEEFPKAH